ncbi:MAG: hypothetical protein VX519_06485 [Myxococcota bacterium]|nr:hypothetical protein [Myxococcota bacterium]
MRREPLAYATLVLTLAWFALGAPRASRTLLAAHARTIESIQLEHITAAINLGAQRDPESLPKGEEAQRIANWLQEALALEPTRHDWPLRAFSVLTAEQVDTARQIPMPSTTQSRKWPATPGVILDVVVTTSTRYGSATDPVPPTPAGLPWSGASPMDLGESLLGLVSEGPELSETQARGILSAAIAGMNAHEAQSHLVEDMASRLDSGLIAAVPMELVHNMPPDRQQAMGSEALKILSLRGAQIP